MLSTARAARLGPLMQALAEACPIERRGLIDPVEIPHEYSRREDIEVAALLATCLAYGRPQVFKPVVRQVLKGLGSAPGDAVQSLTVAQAKRLLDGFLYRFNLPADVAVLLLGMGRVLRDDGTFETRVVNGLREGGTIRHGLAALTTSLRDGAPRAPILKALGPTRGLAHLLPDPLANGASKRLHLFLRWMVRGPDAVDFGLWKQLTPGDLVVPLDTHIARLSRWLGLTKRSDQSHRTAWEITESLRRLDPVDPIRFDFPLCHFGMSGQCPARPKRDICRNCALRGECSVGRRLVASGGGSRRPTV